MDIFKSPMAYRPLRSPMDIRRPRPAAEIQPPRGGERPRRGTGLEEGITPEQAGDQPPDDPPAVRQAEDSGCQPPAADTPEE